MIREVRLGKLPWTYAESGRNKVQQEEQRTESVQLRIQERPEDCRHSKWLRRRLVAMRITGEHASIRSISIDPLHSQACFLRRQEQEGPMSVLRKINDPEICQ